MKISELQTIAAMAYKEANQHPLYNSLHEGWAVLHEEYKEVEKIMMQKEAERNYTEMREEAMDIIAVGIRLFESSFKWEEEQKKGDNNG